MEKELKAVCPFCKTNDLYLVKEYIVDEQDYETEIFCNRCKISFRREDDFGDVDKNRQALIDFWNTKRRSN